MEINKDNRLVIIVKIEKYIEYMLTILLKLPRTEKFSIGIEVKTSMYEMLKNILLASKIDKSFSKVIAIAENYPELKANTNFLSLQSELKEIENKLNSARLIYNNTVTRYNTKVESVPSNLIAKMFNFEKKDLFKLDDSKKENIKVNF